MAYVLAFLREGDFCLSFFYLTKNKKKQIIIFRVMYEQITERHSKRFKQKKVSCLHSFNIDNAIKKINIHYISF